MSMLYMMCGLACAVTWAMAASLTDVSINQSSINIVLHELQVCMSTTMLVWHQDHMMTDDHRQAQPAATQEVLQ